MAASLALTSSASAQGQADLASKLNEEGKELMFAQRFAEASAKFRDAVARVPEPKYFFNLCTSLFQEGKFDEAMTACNAVDKNNPTPEQKAKTDKLIGKIQAEAKSQNLTLSPAGGGGGNPNLPPDPNLPPPDPNNPNNPPPPTYTPVVGRAPSVNLVAAGPPLMNKYTWTLGIDLFAGGGTIGQADYYGSAATGFRIKSDYLLNPASGIGAQGYLGISHFGQGEMQSASVYTLDVFDIGVAAYKHLCDGTSRMCITPLAGIQLALMSPAGEEDGYGEQVFNYSAIGARLEAALTYGLGTRGEHVLSVALGVNAYSSVFSESMDAFYTAQEVGLDKGGAAGYLSIGYTYRFNTPIGRSPFVTLE
ncbi:MAG: hypothetical protein JNL83_38695 [Myxococcales bacterium]|nr:hypothetical protein [Myxococcales bacterium]